MSGEIKARIILEMLGGPKDYLESALKDTINKLKKDYKVTNEVSQEAIETKDPKGLWTTFAEIELTVENIDNIMSICFDYMPSAIEILEPNNLDIKAKDLMDLFNDLLARLHQYDMAIKNLRAENILLKKEKKK